MTYPQRGVYQGFFEFRNDESGAGCGQKFTVWFTEEIDKGLESTGMTNSAWNALSWLYGEELEGPSNPSKMGPRLLLILHKVLYVCPRGELHMPGWCGQQDLSALRVDAEREEEDSSSVEPGEEGNSVPKDEEEGDDPFAPEEGDEDSSVKEEDGFEFYMDCQDYEMCHEVDLRRATPAK